MKAGYLASTNRLEDERLKSDGEGRDVQGRKEVRRMKSGAGVVDTGRRRDRLYWMGDRWLRYHTWWARTCGADLAGAADYGSIYRQPVNGQGLQLSNDLYWEERKFPKRQSDLYDVVRCAAEEIVERDGSGGVIGERKSKWRVLHGWRDVGFDSRER